MKTATLIELQAHLKALNLSHMVRHLEVSLRQAKENSIGYDGSLAIFHGPRKLADYDQNGQLQKKKKSKAA